jgi:hypothetical protein
MQQELSNNNLTYSLANNRSSKSNKEEELAKNNLDKDNNKVVGPYRNRKRKRKLVRGKR